MHLGDGDRKICRLLGAVGGERERQLVARLGTHELVVKAAGHPALADLVQPFLGVEPNHGLALAGALEIERDLIADDNRAIDISEAALTADFLLHGFVDVFIGGRDRRHLDPKAAVAGNGDLRADLARGVKCNRTGFLATGDLDIGCGDEIDVVLAHCLGKVVGDAVAERLLARSGDADTCLKHLARRLAGPEAWHTHLTGDLFEC
ncbi:unannotated protein [freshwater metagenome]|uniref:Unannotated protein n=1 Tax=freshwater metagenome TaxID=449393 RepID=A0A6J7EWN5_9ZZZZ